MAYIGYREQQARKEYFEQEAERERLAREERERPLREAESKYQQTVNELAKVERENVLKMKDDQFYISPELVGKKLSWPEAHKYNAEQARLFADSCPEYYPTAANQEALISYLVERNDTNIFDAETLRRAFYRLDSLGLMQHAPTPAPVIEHIQEPKQPKEQPKEQPSPNSVGHDLQTGELREYTRWEIEQMSASDFRRAFNLKGIYGKTIDPVTGREVVER